MVIGASASRLAVGAIVCAFLAATAPGHAEPPLPPAVEADIAANRKACEPETSRLEPGFASSRDLNQDGIADIVLDYAHFVCGTSHSFFCGSAGCLETVFVSQAGAFRKVLDENVQALSFKVIKGRPAMLVSRAGSACGRSNAESCRSVQYLDAAPRTR